MKILINLLLIISYITLGNAQSNVYVYTLLQPHDLMVKNAFLSGYNSISNSWSGIINTGIKNPKQAADDGNIIYIKSYADWGNYYTETVEAYPNMLCFYPTGSNTYMDHLYYNQNCEFIEPVLTGAGNANLVTAYSVEFWSIDPYYPNHLYASYANGYIAGQILFIRDSLDCSLWEARYRARVTASNSNCQAYDGFGKINILDAINYSGDIIDDPYPLQINDNTDNQPFNYIENVFPLWYKPSSP